MTASDQRLVFGVGLGRTGTASLNTAFNDLGWRSIHFPKDADTRRQVTDWLRASERPQPLRLRRLEVVDGLTDSPIAACYQGFGQSYPDAKFVLTVRDTKAWLESCAALFSELAEVFRDHPTHPVIEYTTTLANHRYGGTSFDSDRLADVQEEHDVGVTDWARRNGIDLLVIDVADPDAYATLSEFLNGTRTDGRFPLKNRREQTIIRQARTLTLRR